MSVTVSMVHLASLKVQISRQTHQQSLPCQCAVLNVAETAPKRAFKWLKEVNKQVKRYHKLPVCSSMPRFLNLLFNVQDGSWRSAFHQNSGAHHVERIHHGLFPFRLRPPFEQISVSPWVFPNWKLIFNCFPVWSITRGGASKQSSAHTITSAFIEVANYLNVLQMSTISL